MPDSNPDYMTPKPEKPKASVSFTPGANRFAGKDVDFESLTPKAEAEPPIEQGIDLAGTTKIVFAAGRGKTGKTTLLR